MDIYDRENGEPLNSNMPLSGAGNPDKLSFSVYDNDIGTNMEIQNTLLKPGKPYWSNMKTSSRDGINNSGIFYFFPHGFLVDFVILRDLVVKL